MAYREAVLMRSHLLKAAILSAAIIACAAVPTRAWAMSLSFSWGPTKACFDRNSPPIRLKGVPRGTKRIRFFMKDLDAPHFRHGGGVVDYKGGNVFPYGSFRYKGPCPPSRHRYRITAQALDANGKVLATASAVRAFP